MIKSKQKMSDFLYELGQIINFLLKLYILWGKKIKNKKNLRSALGIW